MGTLEALHQLENEPNGLSMRIIHLRAYARAKYEMEAATGAQRTRVLKDNPLATMVLHIQAEIGRERQQYAENRPDD